MAYTVTKIADGDFNLGSLNGEFVQLQPAPSDYPTGGYALIDGVSVVNNPALNANVDLYRVITALPAGGQGGLSPVFNPSTKKIQIYENPAIASTPAAAAPQVEVAAGTDLSAYTFLLELKGQ